MNRLLLVTMLTAMSLIQFVQINLRRHIFTMATTISVVLTATAMAMAIAIAMTMTMSTVMAMVLMVLMVLMALKVVVLAPTLRRQTRKPKMTAVTEVVMKTYRLQKPKQTCALDYQTLLSRAWQEDDPMPGG
jgi:prepilin signal peptidase PulO-like enzyme (type II secretory pathway)